MALIYDAQLRPSKIELLSSWVPRQPWLGGSDASSLEAVGAYRFDDPDGEVGIESHLLRTRDDRILHVPVTYRGAPLEREGAALIGTTEHSVLGTRWVYDGCTDPVFLEALATAILTGARQADLDIVTKDNQRVRREATTRVLGSGNRRNASVRVVSPSCRHQNTSSVIDAEGFVLVVHRQIDAHDLKGAPDGAETLVGTWPGQDGPALLAFLDATANGLRSGT